MFGIKNILVLYFSKTNLQAAVVSDAIIAKKYNPLEYNQDNLPEILTKIKNTFKQNKIRVLLDDELSYFWNTEIPENILNIREYLASLIKENIPDDISQDSWDFKEIQMPASSKTKSVTIFAPVKSYWEMIKSAIAKNGMEIIAVEPVGLAKTRNPDPIIGIALKTDVIGRDEEVLNLNINTKNALPVTYYAPGRRRSNNPFLTILILALIIIIPASGYWIYKKINIKTTKAPAATPTTAAPPTLSPVPSIAIANLNIQILNGTGVAGTASKTKTQLTSAGFTNIDVGNASNSAFLKTTVSVKPNLGIDLQNKLKNALNDQTLTIIENLTYASKYDVLIIVGEAK